MFQLSLRQKLLANPILGLALIGLLTLAYIGFAEKHKQHMEHISGQDLQLLDRYTDLFTDLSRHHMTLYQLLYDAPRSDEGSIYDRGRALLDNIQLSSNAIMKLFKDSNSHLQKNAFSLRQISELIDHLAAYRHKAISAIEMTSVDLNLASAYLNEANQLFSTMHENFAQLLDNARIQIRDEAVHQAKTNQRQSYWLAAIGLSLSFILLFLGFNSASRISTRLQQQIAVLDNLRQSDDVETHNTHRDELDNMSEAIEVFRSSLQKINEQEASLAKKNEDLLVEINERVNAEKALLQAKDELEHKVRERTRSLTEVNLSLSQEVNQRKQAEQRLFIYKQVIDHTDEAVIITDPETRVIEINPAYEKKLGYSREQVLGQFPSLVQSGLHDKSFYQDLWKSLLSRKHWSGEIRNQHKNGQIIPFWVTINAILDNQGNVTQYIGLFRDISALKQAEKDLEQLAYYDPLTGLPNRALFNDRLHQMIINAKRHHCHLAVLFVDLDRFKEVNDTLGHSMGDALLVQVAGRMTDVLREQDTVSRLGGDEFTIILPGLENSEDVVIVADKIVKCLQQPFQLGADQVVIGASIGIALYPEHGHDTERLKKNADVAMYQAKEMGRNRYQLYDDQLQKSTEDRLTLIQDIRQALTNDEFSLNYQPIVDIATGEAREVEALIRWQRKGGKWIRPDEFIPVAEEHGLIQDIDQWVLHTACEFAVKTDLDLTIHVNLSASQFQNPYAPEMIRECLQKSGLPAQKLCLEITETAVITDPSCARMILQEITDLGVSVALDDFGTGYSSLTHLTRFPLHRLKIDRSFITSLLHEDATEAVIRSMIDLSRSMGINVVAEGIEELAQHQCLQDMGCHYGQGYFYAKPMPEMQLIEWFDARKIDPALKSAQL